MLVVTGHSSSFSARRYPVPHDFEKILQRRASGEARV